MEQADFAAQTIVVLSCAVAGVALWRNDNRPFAIWMWGWGVLVLAGTSLELGLPALGSFGSSLFAALVLTGALCYAGRPGPIWPLAAALVVGGLRVAAVEAGAPLLGSAAQLAFEAPALFAAAWLVARALGRHASLLQWLIVPSLLAVALVSAGDAAADLVRGEDRVWGNAWMVVGFAALSVQILAAVEAFQARLRASDARFRRLSEQSSAMIAEVAPDGTVAYASPNLHAVLGYRPEELVGLSLPELAHRLACPELAMARTAGELADRIAAAPENAAIGVLDARRRRVSLELHAVDFRDSDGQRRALLLGSDVTRRLEVQERSSQTRRRESLAVLAGGIAHDFNNLLVSVVGSASLLRSAIPEDSPDRALLDHIEQAGQRATHLVQQLQHYAGGRPIQAQPVDLSGLVRDTASLLRAKLPGSIELVMELAPDLPSVDGNPTELQQCATNLIQNAADAMPREGGKIQVETHVVELAAQDLGTVRLDRDLLPGRYVCLEIIDSGAGMDASTRARMFDPFFSTKGSGHGLGLSALLGIVHGHGGAVEVESKLGAGTRVRLYLPPGRLPALEASAQDPGTPPPGWGQGTVLVVDDEDTVRRVVVKMLQGFGFDVLEARDGQEALARLEAHPSRLAVVLLDLTMPGLGGEETAGALRQAMARRGRASAAGAAAEAEAQATRSPER